jgi:hypothetical protein
MNGQRTGGEKLPPVEAGSTGRPFNGAGIAAHLTRDRLGGTLEKCNLLNMGRTRKVQRGHRKHIQRVASAVAKSLAECSWAAVDNFAPRETVLAIRKEVLVMEGNYEEGEIWIGSSNEVCILELGSLPANIARIVVL